ncbi:hypothetical protein KIPB_011638 [Kipferlia bialata]|uniref:Uncharacterized protein n=1 Tax=Kipferlia bialata TaxID=797122 RepID=A0A391NUS6_9EUKA|nr:hypothetical protein KIPB_011638 [Kipferlia bialata]|eukprot:g11638.t1
MSGLGMSPDRQDALYQDAVSLVPGMDRPIFDGILGVARSEAECLQLVVDFSVTLSVDSTGRPLSQHEYGMMNAIIESTKAEADRSVSQLTDRLKALQDRTKVLSRMAALSTEMGAETVFSRSVLQTQAREGGIDREGASTTKWVYTKVYSCVCVSI